MNYLIVVVLSLVGIVVIGDIISTRGNYNKIETLIRKYELELDGPEWSGYIQFIRAYLEHGIKSDSRNNLSFSVFNMFYSEVEDLLKIISIEKENKVLKSNIEPILEDFILLSTKYEALKDTRLSSDLYNSMLRLQDKLKKTTNDSVLNP